MLSRGFYDPLPLWPALMWPLIVSALFFAALRVCQASGQGQGASALDPRHVPDALVLYLFFPAAAVFELCLHGYMFWIMGWMYLPIVIPIYILGWILLPAALDSMPGVQLVLPGIHLVMALALLVLLGLLDIPVLSALNAELYGVLSGYPLPG